MDDSCVQKAVQGDEQVSERKGPRETALAAEGHGHCICCLYLHVGPRPKDSGQPVPLAPSAVARDPLVGL